MVKPQQQKEFELWASHQDELSGRTTKWYLDGYSDPRMRAAYIGYVGGIESLQRERDALREALNRISFECSDDLSGRANQYINEVLAKGASQ